MPSSQGSITDQNPIDSATGVANSEHGTKVLSVNMKNTAKFLRSQISRSFTTASKKLDAAKVYLNDPDVNRNDRELRIIDMLQKEIMMILSIIETDAHFFDVIKTRDVILSDKERAALKDVVIKHFEKKPREETIQDLKAAQDTLRQILISQEYRFESQISEAELAELSHNLDSFLVGDDDDNENNGDDIVDNGDQEIPRLSPVTENTPILTTGSPPTFQNTAVITLSPSNENGGFVYNSDQPVVPPLIQQVRLPPREPFEPQPVAPPLNNQARLPPREPFELQPARDTNEQHANRPSPPLMEKIVRSCPCCEENHELFHCTHKHLQRYCALNKRCIYCTSNEHKSIECDMVSHKSSHAPSIMKELGMDTESNTFVRTFVTKIPDKIMREMRVLFVNGREPTTQEVLTHFTEAVNDLTFPEKFKSGNVSSQGRTKELPNSIMTLDAPSNQNPRQKKQQPTDNNRKESNGKKPAQTENSKKQSNAPKQPAPKPENQNKAAGKTQNNTQSKPNNNATQKTETVQQQVNVSDASAVYRPVNVAYSGYHPPHPQYNNPSYFPVYPNIGSPAPQNWNYGQNSNEGQGSSNNQSTKKGNPGNSTRQNSKNTKVAKGPAPLPLGLLIGEQIEPCYNSGIGWDKNFIAHTFCRSDQTPNKCCFICGPGHSILQCPIPSFQVRKYLRDSNSCHNCTKQGHATEDWPSKARVSPPAALPTATQTIGSSDPMPTGAPELTSSNFTGPATESHLGKSDISCTGKLDSFLSSLQTETLFNASLLNAPAKTSHLPFVALRTTDGKVLLALVDSGASLSVLSHDSADRLGLKTLATKELTIAGYSKTTTEKSNIYQVSFKTSEKPFKMFIAGAPRLPDTKYDVPPLEISDIRFLRDNKIDFEQLSIDRLFNNQPIDMILGNDLLSRLLGRSRRVLLPSERYIEMTPFAPIIYPPPRASVTASSGSQEDEMEAFVIEGFINMLQTPEKKSNDQMGTLINEISQLWKLENLDLWIDGLQWKDKIPKDLLPRWEIIRKQFSEVSISIPRMLRPRGDYERVHFIVFSDASKDTYACATYLLYEYAHGPPKIGLLAAKSKVKPTASTTLTIPRLELLAIEIGSRIAESAIAAMEIAESKKKNKKSTEQLVVDREPELKVLTDALTGMCMTAQADEKYRSFVPYRRSNSLSKVISMTHSTLRCLTKMFKNHVWEGDIMKKFTASQGPLSLPTVALQRRAVARHLVMLEHYKEAESLGLKFPAKLDPVIESDALSNQHASVDDLSSMDACLMSSGRKLKDDNTSPLSDEKAGLMSSGRQLFNSNHASRNRLASNDDLSSKDACLMSSGRKPLDDVTSPLSDNSKTRKFTNDRAMPVPEAAGLMSSGRQLKLQSSNSTLNENAENSVIPVGMNEPRLSGRHPTAHHKVSRTGENSKSSKGFSRREPSRIASSLVNNNSVSSVPGPLIEVNTDDVVNEAKDSTSEAGLMSSGRQPEVLPTHARLMPPGRKHGGVNQAGLMSSGRQPNNNEDHNSIDEAFARLPANRLRPYQARKAKTRIKHYAHVVDSGGPQIPQSVVNLQGPLSL
ncbi:unnamed protein product [Caenorhabditis brenneri]